MGQILLTKGHPKACSLDVGEVKHQTLELFVVKKVALTHTDTGVMERTMDLLRLRLYPLTIEVVFTLLGNLADIDFGIKVRSKRLVMIPSVAVYNIEVVDFIEVMLGGIGGKYARHPGVETTSEDSGKAGLFEAFAIRPLPAILIFCLV